MSQSTANRRKATLYGQELNCKNECGFYGNPEWLGYCSQCYKELNKAKVERSSKPSSKKLQRSYSDAHESAALGFSKFEEKKKQHIEKKAKTMKNFLHKTKKSTTNSPSRDIFPANDIQLLTKNFKDVIAKDVLKHMSKTVEAIAKCSDRPTDEQSELVQDFYNIIANKCETHVAYQDLSSEQVDELMDRVEEILMSHLHRTLSQQISSENEEKDLAIQKRIRNLNWIAPQHLGLNINETSPEVRDLIDKAIADMIAMDSKTVPQQKIKCTVTCSESIFSLIKLCQGVTASADEFLPAMVYVVLKANPPLLQSNIKYITSYSTPARLRSGEGAYYFTNLCCAVAFIEDLSAESLNMSEDEFQRHLSGEFSHSEQSAAFEGLRQMNLNLLTLNEIEEKNRQMMNDMNNLRDDMNKFQETLQKCKPQVPLLIHTHPYTIPASTDMSIVPEVLRGRVLFAPTEDILVDIDNQPEPAPHEGGDALMSTSPDQATPMSPFLNELIDVQPEATPRTASASSSFSPLQVLLPSQATPHSASYSQATPHSASYSQAVVDIQNVEYPTHMISELKSDASVEFGPFESCDTAETDSAAVAHPLVPESGLIMEENLNLPPPLQPVVVQTLSDVKK